MHWHHHNARLSSQIFVNQIQVNLGRGTPVMEKQLQKKEKTINGILRMLEYWLRHGNQYPMTQSHPSLADISCYNEVVQLEVMGLLTHVDAKFPKVAAWLKRMKVQYRAATINSTQFGSCVRTEAFEHFVFFRHSHFTTSSSLR